MFGIRVAALWCHRPQSPTRLLYRIRFKLTQAVHFSLPGRSSSDDSTFVSQKDSAAKRQTSKPESTPFSYERYEGKFDQLIRDGFAFQGSIRVLHHSLAYVKHPLDNGRVFIFGANRLRALPGDIVLVRICSLGLWKVLETEPGDKTKSVRSEISTSSNGVVLDDPDTAGTADITISSEDTLVPDFVESPSLTPSLDSLVSAESFKQPSKFHHLFHCKTLYDLVSDPSQSEWPRDLPPDIDLTETPHLTTPLPCPPLVRTGVVVTILKKNPRSRRLLGHIGFYQPTSIRSTRFATPVDPASDSADAVCLFVPSSAIQPFVLLNPATVPKDILVNHSLGVEKTYICRITGWNDKFGLPYGIIDSQLGDINQLEPATQRLLLQHGFEDREFSPEHLDGLPTNPDDFVIPEREYLHRKDFRSCCIISIDPASAKDIDDALHIKSIGSDLFEVGVHIADVSYFVKPGTPLDREAAARATSIYLVQRVIPMLPEILSQHLCSLQPSADKLAFSVVLTVRSSGEITNTWFGRSIIRSRAKLSYDQALALLEHAHLDMQDPKMNELSKLLPIPEPPFTLMHVRDSLIKLNDLARNLREKRIANGALTLQKSKIEFDLPSTTFDPASTEFSDTDAVFPDQRTVWPRGYSIQAPGLTHQLIEEWMLVANQAVAKRLFYAFQKHLITMNPRWPGALLRSHSPPSEKHIQEITELLSSDGITLPDGTSRSISTTLHRHNEMLRESGCCDKKRNAVMGALSHLIYIRMKMALYFSLDDLLKSEPLLMKSGLSDPETIFQHTWHYGLNVPLYTHFTSPIRRYADLLVHRQLDAILTGSRGKANVRSQFSHMSLLALSTKAAWCNNQRMWSRRVQEASQQLFLTACLRDCGPLHMDATVLDLTVSHIKLFLSDFGLVISCALKKFLLHTQKWDVITSDRQDVSADPSNDPARQQTRLAVVVELSSESTQQPHSDQDVIRRVIRCLSVVPCRVYSQPDRLVLNAEYIPDDDLTESDEEERHGSASP